MEEKVFEYIREKGLFKAGDSVVVGVSGGADSVCLLLLLDRLKSQMALTLTAVHVHHGIRGGSADRDMEFVKSLCGRLDIPCRVFCEDIPALAKENSMGEEEMGRLVRYGIFRQVLEETGGDAIAVAHHADDNGETFLWNLVRGAGLAGLSGMGPVNGQVVRPLLCVRKREILAYLRDRGEEWREDETNDSWEYTRNRIRGRVIPELEQLNEKAVPHINSAAEIIGEAAQWLQEEAQCWLDREAKVSEGLVIFPVKGLAEKRQIFRMQVYINGLKGAGAFLKDIGKTHLILADGLLSAAHGTAVDLPGGGRISRQYGSLVIEGRAMEEGVAGKDAMEKETTFQIFPRQAGEKIPEKNYTKWFDYDKIKDRLSVRTRRTGDYIEIAPGCQRKTLKSYMIDEKIPRQLRGLIPVVADGSHVLWIVGYRISEGYKVREDTKTILQITFKRKGTEEQEENE